MTSYSETIARYFFPFFSTLKNTASGCLKFDEDDETSTAPFLMRSSFKNALDVDYNENEKIDIFNISAYYENFNLKKYQYILLLVKDKKYISVLKYTINKNRICYKIRNNACHIIHSSRGIKYSQIYLKGTTAPLYHTLLYFLYVNNIDYLKIDNYYKSPLFEYCAMVIDHKDNNTENNSPDNLQLITNYENTTKK